LAATGAAYERKNFRWLFRTPRHHAERTRKPAPGKNSVTRRTVRSRFSPLNPGAMIAVSGAAASIPISTITEVLQARRPKAALAKCVASVFLPRLLRRAYTGTKEAERTPSPKRF